MKAVSLEYAQSHMEAVMNSAQKQRIVVLRGGKPCAVIMGIESYDQEDLRLASSQDFWEMIEKRRRESSILLSELKLRLRTKGNGRAIRKEIGGRRKKGRSPGTKV